MRYHINVIIAASILILFMFGLFSQPLISFAQKTDQLPQIPNTIEETKPLAEKGLKAFPDAMKKVWKDDAMPIWRRTWIKWWKLSIKPWIENEYYNIQILLENEIKRRKPAVKKEFKREKKEMKQNIRQEAPKIEKTIWERLREIIK